MCIKDQSESEQDDFFQRESLRGPPSLSKNGQLYSGTKAAMVDCLPNIPEPGKNAQRNRTTMAALDVARVIHNVNLGNNTHNFKEYAHLNVIPFLKSQLSSTLGQVEMHMGVIWPR